MTDEARALAEAARGLTEALERFNNGKLNGNGNGKPAAIEIVLRIVVGLALAASLAAHAFLWYTNATMAVQTEQILQLRSDIAKAREHLLTEIRETRMDFVAPNTDNIKGLDSRVRALERGR